MVHNKTDKTSTASNHNLVGHRIDGGRLEFMSVLGLGAYGVVYLARDLNSPDMDHPQLYAVKALNKIGLDARQKSFQRREIALHSLASTHPSIVTLHAVIESPSCIFVILDYCPDGDLFGMITEKQKYLGKPESIKQVFIQIVEAVQFCHRLGISHRDLKPENILCKKGGDDVVLADFGLATSERTSSDFGCGSTFYMSPECQGGLFQRLGSYSTLHNDIWSLGVILVNLTCGRNPWKQACPTDETFRAYLANPDFLRSILPVSEPCNKILKRIFALNPLARISLAELKTEIAKVETFNMTPHELSQSTKATREAARAWRQDVPPSPKLPPPSSSSLWKSTLGKKTKKHNRHQSGAEAQRKPLPAEGNVWDQPVRYEESSSSSSPTFFDNGSSDSSLWNYPGTRPTLREKLSNHLRSPINGLREGRGGNGRDSEESTPRIRFVSPPQTPRTSHRSHAQNAIIGRVPTGNLVSAFTSASISSHTSSSSSSGEWSKKTRGFTSRFGVRKQVNFVPSPTEQASSSSGPSTRKKLLIKPMTFARANAPSPIVLKPATPDSSASSSSSRSRGLVTPGSKKGKHPILTFLPSTPPSSASPNSTTFGFSRKATKFYPQEMPPTPTTPTHPGSDDFTTGNPPRRRLPKKKTGGEKFSLFSSSDEDCSEGGAKVDADFDVDDDDDDDDDGGYRSTYPAYAEWVSIKEKESGPVKALS
ncbi:hypothetical protein CROQUDRAFT_49432 [Cronartium quercuum f. sp. fusiforme G11]|uniref:Protein kinase domain-containing protein n=1 Tax=Cronartium quercuum f. sp. fusiforme G11 TaxID=708437 RepID=A0A9P6NFD5_9BASI|nr:hypothetical protein CROQUDRAFT_49432 [Cronartium quercuum f. sp. fusiforme G11]